MYFVIYGIQTKKSVLPVILILSVQVHRVRISECAFSICLQLHLELHYKDTEIIWKMFNSIENFTKFLRKTVFCL